jgi:alpha-L-fucosidase
MKWPAYREIIIHSLAARAGHGGENISSVRLLGYANELSFQQQSNGLHIHVPEQQIGEYAHVFRIELAD